MSYFLSSRRFWVNFITIVVGIVGLITKQFPIYANLGAMVVGILNLILSTISSQPIGWRKNVGFVRK